MALGGSAVPLAIERYPWIPIPGFDRPAFRGAPVRSDPVSRAATREGGSAIAQPTRRSLPAGPLYQRGSTESSGGGTRPPGKGEGGSQALSRSMRLSFFLKLLESSAMMVLR
jgi:hypothetical protein